MTLIKWKPQTHPGYDFDRLFGDFFGNRPLGQACGEEGCSWSPRADILENDKEYEILVDLPGVSKDDITLKAEDGILTLRGERGALDAEKVKLRRVERLHGRFERHFRLPEDVDAEAIEARFDNGMLAIRITKSERVAGRQIEVR